MFKCDYCVGDKYESITSKLQEVFDGAEFCPYCGRYLGENEYDMKEPPTVVETDDGDVLGEREETHPAYAQLSFSRQSGGYDSLYGSAIKHQETICMTVHPSKKISSAYSERYFARLMPLIQVRMSQSQFAEVITSMNMGAGVPVTLESLRGKRMPKCDEESVSEVANRDLKKKMNQFANKMSDGYNRSTKILQQKGNIKVAERNEIIGIYSMMMQDLRSNLPFLHDCMVEAYDKTATDTKADIEAFYTNAVMKLGMNAINDKQIKYKVNESGRLEVDNDYVDVEVDK